MNGLFLSFLVMCASAMFAGYVYFRQRQSLPSACLAAFVAFCLQLLLWIVIVAAWHRWSGGTIEDSASGLGGIAFLCATAAFWALIWRQAKRA